MRPETAESQDDDALMIAFRDGSEDALAILFDRHAARLQSTLARMTGNEALANDLTQVTFLSVVRGRGRFTAQARFVPWLFTIAMNAWRDHRRRRRREVLTRDGVSPEVGHEDRAPDPGLERRVREALQRLPTEQREAVVLHKLEGFTFREIAEMVGASPAAVKVRAHRGYAALRGLLEDTWREVMP